MSKKVIEITEDELFTLNQLSIEVYNLAELVGSEDNEKVYRVSIQFRNILTNIQNRIDRS